MDLEKFYFTYGPDHRPSSTVRLNIICASVYSAKEFEKTKMFGSEGNFGRRCRETITLNIAVNKAEEGVIF